MGGGSLSGLHPVPLSDNRQTWLEKGFGAEHL